jgi:hypothetical protein
MDHHGTVTFQPCKAITEMLRKKLFNKLFHKYHSSDADNIELFSLGEEETAAPHYGSHHEVNDLSYEDALLDTQARLFFRSEPGSSSESVDPSESFAKVMARIESHSRPNTKQVVPELPRLPAENESVQLPLSGRSTPAFAQRLRRVVSGGTASRLVPNGVALLLLIMILGSDAAHLLRTDDYSRLHIAPDQPGADRPMSRESGSSPGSPVLISAPVPQPQYNTLKTASLHPIEMGMRRNEREMWIQIAPEYFSYRRTKFGPE